MHFFSSPVNPSICFLFRPILCGLAASSNEMTKHFLFVKANSKIIPIKHKYFHEPKMI